MSRQYLQKLEFGNRAVFELAPGNGRVSANLLADMFVHVDAIEQSATMVARAKARMLARGTPYRTITC